MRSIALLAVAALGFLCSEGAVAPSTALARPTNAAALPGSPDEPTELDVAASGKKVYSVAAMGDSLTDPKSHGGKYLEYLADKCPKSRFDSYGKGGNMVNQMRKRFARDVLGEGGDGSKPKYTHVIILGGIGDILSNETAGRTAEKIEKDLGEMYQLAHDKGVSVIALTLPPWGAFKAYNDDRHKMTMDVNAWIKKVPPNVDHSVDIYPLLSCGKERDLCDDYAWPDKLHWAKKGHDVVGAELLKEIFSDCE